MRAADLMASVRTERNLAHKRELEHLVLCYLRLADLADRNSETDVVYEPPWDPAAEQHPQPKPKHDEE